MKKVKDNLEKRKGIVRIVYIKWGIEIENEECCEKE